MQKRVVRTLRTLAFWMYGFFNEKVNQGSINVDSPSNSTDTEQKQQTHCFHVERQREALASDTAIHIVNLPVVKFRFKSVECVQVNLTFVMM